MSKIHVATSFAVGTYFFPGLAFFTTAHFARPAYFGTALFAEDAFFQTAHFAGDASFRTAHFAGSAYFGTVHFAGNASFGTAHFAGDAFFTTAHFAEDVDFAITRFAGGASFALAHFAGNANLTTAHFAGKSSFATVHFAGDASFALAYFAGPAFFSNAHIAKYATFETAHFAGSADFSNGAFKGKTVFAGAMFHTEVPAFFHREMHQDTRFTDDPKLWPKVTPDNATEGKRAYTRLRQVAAEIYDPDLEHFFLRQEMDCKRRLERDKKAWFEVAMFTLFRWVAEYGISVTRPFWLMVIVWAFGVGCFLGYFESGVKDVLITDIQENRFGTAAGLSFANLFGFLGINRLYFTELLQAAPDRVQIVAGAQTVLGVVLLFFFGLGLRNRFRLK